MRILEASAAAFLIIFVLPLLVAGWLGTRVFGMRPMFRQRVLWREGESREVLEFNTGHGELGLAFRRSSITRLPTLFWVLNGRTKLGDFIRWGECR